VRRGEEDVRVGWVREYAVGVMVIVVGGGGVVVG
jgi:hypothetical protein